MAEHFKLPDDNVSDLKLVILYGDFKTPQSKKELKKESDKGLTNIPQDSVDLEISPL